MALAAKLSLSVQKEEKKLQVVISDTKHVPPSSIYVLSILSWEIRETGQERGPPLTPQMT